MPPTPPPEWPLAKRVAFRFLFVYLALYFFPLPTGLADPEWLSGIFDGVWHRIVPWVAARTLHLQITNFSNGSGDTTYDYVRVLCMAILALLGAAAWSLLDRRRKEYRTLHQWARLWLRYALAVSLLTYGVMKVIKLQFPDPGYTKLTETYGESSPMSLLWTFMGFSAGYTFFAGAGEVLGALLLFFRRTTTLGLLVAIGVLSNVVMLNFCYDVPVKLGSAHLLALAVFLLTPDLRRLADMLVFNRPTQPADLGPHLTRRWARRGAIALKVAIIGGALGSQTWGALEAREAWGKPPVAPEGWYAVSSFVEDGAEVPAVATDAHRWKTFVLRRGFVRLWGQDRSSRLFKADGEPANGEITLLPTGDDGEPVKGATPAGKLSIAFGGGENAKLEGTLDGHRIEVAMARQETSKFPLMARGFHWISEQPFNK